MDHLALQDSSTTNDAHEKDGDDDYPAFPGLSSQPLLAHLLDGLSDDDDLMLVAGEDDDADGQDDDADGQNGHAGGQDNDAGG